MEEGEVILARGKFISELKSAFNSNNYNKMERIFLKVQDAEEDGYELTEEEDDLWVKISVKIMSKSQVRGKSFYWEEDTCEI
jgi:hypothetical protein